MAATKTEYNSIAVEAARKVLLEVTHLLYEYREAMVVVGGSVPGMILGENQPEHIGSIDVDIALNHQAIQESGYRTILQLLLQRGYIQGTQPFVFYRSVTINDKKIKIEVDFLAGEYGGTGKSHRTQSIQDLQPRKARACDLAFQNPVQLILRGELPEGGKDQVYIRVASIVPFLMMKAQALNNRLKEKDAYDIYYCLVHYPGGLDSLIEAFLQFPKHPLIQEGIRILSEKFSSPGSIGSVFITHFLDEHDPDEQTRIQRDAFERIQYLVNAVMK